MLSEAKEESLRKWSPISVRGFGSNSEPKKKKKTFRGQKVGEADEKRF